MLEDMQLLTRKGIPLDKPSRCSGRNTNEDSLQASKLSLSLDAPFKGDHDGFARTMMLVELLRTREIPSGQGCLVSSCHIGG